MLCLFLLYNNMNQLEVYVYPLPLETLFHFHPLFHSSRLPQWRRTGHPTPVLLPREFCGQRSPVGCCPWGHREPDTTEVT